MVEREMDQATKYINLKTAIKAINFLSALKKKKKKDIKRKLKPINENVT